MHSSKSIPSTNCRAAIAFQYRTSSYKRADACKACRRTTIIFKHKKCKSNRRWVNATVEDCGMGFCIYSGVQTEAKCVIKHSKQQSSGLTFVVGKRGNSAGRADRTDPSARLGWLGVGVDAFVFNRPSIITQAKQMDDQ